MEPIEPAKYQDALRYVGEVLDSYGEEAFTVLEVPDGLEVVVDQDGGQSRALVRIDRDQRSKGPGRGRTIDPLWKSMGTTGGEFFEALGIELERRGAHNILIDRLAGELVLSYSFLDPLRGYAWGKSVAILSISDMRRIFQAGREEIRKTKKRWIF